MNNSYPQELILRVSNKLWEVLVGNTHEPPSTRKMVDFQPKH